MMKKLLALSLIAALPGCGCWRKKTTKETKSVQTETATVNSEKAAVVKKSKTH